MKFKNQYQEHHLFQTRTSYKLITMKLAEKHHHLEVLDHHISSTGQSHSSKEASRGEPPFVNTAQ